MAAVFAADYEGLRSINRKVVGVVRQKRQHHSEVQQQVRCLLLNQELVYCSVCFDIALFCQKKSHHFI